MRLLVPLIGLVLLVGSAPASITSSAAQGRRYPAVPRIPAQSAAPRYQVPIGAGPTSVLTGFHPPATRYGRGHLGVDLAAAAGDPVLAAAAGVVRFAGSVAGRGVVVLAHPDGISTEYEPVAAVVVAGQQVTAGQPIGVVRGVHRGCPPTGCLHWGARRGSSPPPVYLDPLSLLAPLGVVRLLPWN